MLLLGPVTVEGAAGRVDSNRKRPSTEVAVYLALHPGVDHHALDDALWPGQRGDKRRRNSAITRLRSWFGTGPDGTPYLPRVQDVDDHRYRLGPHITCDWTDFQHHARTGLAETTEDGDLALRRALSLVRGRPFAATDPQRYAWAEPALQEMTSAIVDVAYELSTRCREAGDHTSALWAAAQGLLAAEENEMLHRAVFLAHHAAGDISALREAAARLARINDQLGGGVDMEAETAVLLQRFLPRPVRQPVIVGSEIS
ncbi:bacterial transcriptional activator domain-containing protein [Streptomyces olivoreticuli]